MKVRESGMPDASYWETLFDVPLILEQMHIDASLHDIAEIGCGYGTFTIEAAKLISGIIYAIDIEPQMTELTAERAKREDLKNVSCILCDVTGSGTGLSPGSVNYVMLFNILHHESPMDLFREAKRMLRPGGLVGCIHWNYDPTTPRGPSMNIRPKPEQIHDWLRGAGFGVKEGPIDLPPFHFGWIGTLERLE